MCNKCGLIGFPSGQERKEPRKSELGTQIWKASCWNESQAGLYSLERKGKRRQDAGDWWPWDSLYRQRPVRGDLLWHRWRGLIVFRTDPNLGKKKLSLSHCSILKTCEPTTFYLDFEHCRIKILLYIVT